MHLNQLKLADDSRLGLALVLLIMMLDAAVGANLGAARLLSIIGVTTTEAAVSTLDLLFLVTLTTCLAGYQFHRVRHRLGLRPLADVDERLYADAHHVGRLLAGGRPRFLVGANLLDGNAFCLSAGRFPIVVLGGGLRLMLRKQRHQALAVIAHECGHISAGDTVFLVITWYFFVSFSCLIALDMTLFWISALAGFEKWINAGHTPWRFFLANLGAFLPHYLSRVISVVTIGVVLAHFIRQREFRADEFAAQAGWRSSLMEALTGSIGNRRKWQWTSPIRFHPGAQDRAARLIDQAQWSQFDFFFLMGMSFLSARLVTYMPLLFSSDTDAAGFGVQFEELRQWINQTIGSVAIALRMELLSVAFFQILLAFCLTLHVHRVSLTQYSLGYPLRKRLRLALVFSVACFLGFIGGVISDGELLQAAMLGEDIYLSTVLVLVAALGFTSYGLFLCLGTILVTKLFAISRVQNGRLQAILLFVGSVIVGGTLSVLASALYYLLIRWGVPLPVMVIPMEKPNSSLTVPSVEGLLGIITTILLLLQMIKIGSPSVKRKLHPNWLVRDEIPKLS